MLFSQTEIENVIIRALCTSLALTPDQVRREAALFSELNMDSLDFLDLMFNLEAVFGTKLRDADFDRLLRPDKSEAALAGEFLSPEEVNGLSMILPALQETARARPVARKELFSFVTVDTLIKMISRKLTG